MDGLAAIIRFPEMILVPQEDFKRIKNTLVIVNDQNTFRKILHYCTSDLLMMKMLNNAPFDGRKYPENN
jgi:hypothetical protein